MKNPDRPRTHRVFVGIKIPPALASLLAGFGRSNLQHAPNARSPKWTDANDLHITLKFLGSVQPALLEQVRTALAAVRAHPFKITLAGADAFGSGILFAGIEKSAQLISLQNAVEQALNPLGFPREQRPYSPHITIARKIGRQHDLVAQLEAFCKHMSHREIFVERFILYESIAGHYQPLQQYDL